MGYNAGIQLSGRRKPLNQPKPEKKKELTGKDFWNIHNKKTMKERKLELKKKINQKLLDKKTIDYLKIAGFIKDDDLDI